MLDGGRLAVIETAAVLGAGVMGAGIAAHLANAGVSVILLDLAEDGPRRSRRAEQAIEGQIASGGFMTPALAARVTPGNIDDDLGLVAGADWIIEAVAEQLDVKRPLFAKLEALRKDGSIVSSNTSTLPLASLIAGQPARFARDFLITHFFNPPRHMRLLELVTGPATRPGAAAAIAGFADFALGKGVVECKDRPGFIANRIGCFWLAAAVAEALALGLTVEEADAVISRPFGLPGTGIFGLLDLVGLDLMPQVWGSLARTLPADDPIRNYDLDPPLIRAMIGRGLTGRKAGGGFYRTVTSDGVKRRQAFDLASGEYRDLQPPALDSLGGAGGDMRALLSHTDRGGLYASRVMGATLAYAAALVPEIADGPAPVDTAMRLGYAWTQGPFELMDRIGPAWVAAHLRAKGLAVPPMLAQAVASHNFYRRANGRRECLQPAGGYRPLQQAPGHLSLAQVKLDGTAIAQNRAGALWDLGDGVACLEFQTKANSFDPDLLAAIESAVAEAARGFRALVLGNDAAGFSGGANLTIILDAIRRQDWGAVEAFVHAGQRAFRKLKFAPVPVVAAVSGSSLGGGCEAALHCAAIQAHAELSLGLVETKIGLIPAWGGCKELLLRLAPDQAFRLIAAAQTSGSALEARALGYLGPGDGITMNRDRLLADAKTAALRLAGEYRPPQPALIARPGPSARPPLLEAAAKLDPEVGEILATLLTGSTTTPLSEAAVYDLEREAFLSLVRRPAAQARIEQMLGARSR